MTQQPHTLKPRHLAAAACLWSMLASASAQAAEQDGPPGAAPSGPGVTIYGVADVALEHVSPSSGEGNTVMMKVGHVPSRLGFKGSEDLGQGLRAGFVLEMGIGMDTGSSLNTAKTFTRESHLTLGQQGVGTLKLGRQQSLLEQAYLVYDTDHLSPYSPALAMRLADLNQDPWDNAISYRSPQWGPWTLQLALGLDEKAQVAPSTYSPQVVGAGTAKPLRSAWLGYHDGPWFAGLAHQTGGQKLTAGGEATQRIWTANAVFRTPSWEVGSIFWRYSNELPTGTVARTDLLMLSGAWRVLPAVNLVAQVGQARDNGQNYYAGFDKGTGRNHYLNLGADYDFSRRTTAYVRLGRISDSGDGFNGRAALSSLAVAEGLTVPANGSVKGVAIGLRHWF